MRDRSNLIQRALLVLVLAGLILALVPMGVASAGVLPDEGKPEGSWAVRVLLPGVGMGIVLGLVFIGIMSLRIRAMRASSKSKERLEALEKEAEEETGK